MICIPPHQIVEDLERRYNDMSIEIALLISLISVGFSVYQGVSNMRRNHKVDERSDATQLKSDATQLTTVIVKLENIGTGIAEIKNEMTNVKNDMKESRERIIIVEESTKMAHKRLDVCEQYCKKQLLDIK